MKRTKLISALVALSISLSLMCSCTHRVTNHDVALKEESVFKVEDTINKVVVTQYMLLCLVNSNEIRSYDIDGELLDSEVLDSEAYDLDEIGEGFYSIMMKNGDIQIIRSYKSDPVNIIYKTHLDKEVVDISAYNNTSDRNNDRFWFVTSDHELYEAGININHNISKDADEDTYFEEPVKIRDNFQGVHRWVGADEDGVLYELNSWEKQKGKFIMLGDELVSSNLQYTIYSTVKSLEKDKPEVLGNLIIGSGSVMYEEDEEFYFSGPAHTADKGKPVSVKNKKLDIPEGYEYAISLYRIVCYDEHNITVYEI